MKNSRRGFIQKGSLAALGLSIAPSLISKQAEKEHLILLGLVKVVVPY